MPEEYNQEPPTEQVISMIEQGYSNQEIINALQEQGYSNQAISEALNQAHIKVSVENVPSPPSPHMQPSLLNQATISQPRNIPIIAHETEPIQQVTFERPSSDQFQELAESIIEEKWQKVLEDIGDLSAWKEKVRNDILSIKQEILRMESRFENLQSAVLGKIKEYDKGVQNLGTNIKALEKLLQNILDPLATNVKELQNITKRLKK